MIKKIIAGFVIYVIVSLLISGMALPDMDPVDFDWLSHIVNAHIATAVLVVILGVAFYCINVLTGD